MEYETSISGIRAVFFVFVLFLVLVFKPCCGISMAYKALLGALRSGPYLSSSYCFVSLPCIFPFLVLCWLSIYYCTEGKTRIRDMAWLGMAGPAEGSLMCYRFWHPFGWCVRVRGERKSGVCVHQLFEDALPRMERGYGWRGGGG